MEVNLRKFIYFLLLLFCIFSPSSFASAYCRVDSDYSDKYTADIKKYKDDLMTVGYPAFKWSSSYYYCWTYTKNDSYANIQNYWSDTGVCDYCVVYDDNLDAVLIVFAKQGMHCKFTPSKVFVVGSGLSDGSWGGVCFASNGSKFRYLGSNGYSRSSGDVDIVVISGSLHLLGFYGTCYDSADRVIEAIPDSTASPSETTSPDGTGGSTGGGGGSDFGSSILSRIGDFFDSFFDNLKNALKDLFIPSSDFMQGEIQGLKDDFEARFNTGVLSNIKDKLSNHNNTTTPEFFDKHFSLGSFTIPLGNKVIRHGDSGGLLAMKSVIFSNYRDEIRDLIRIVFYLLLILSDYNFIIWLLRSAPVSTGGGGGRSGSDDGGD